MTHTKSNILQANEYYPFGMQTASSWTRENATGNNFLANGGTELNTTSQLYDLDFRNYDPALGRMNQVDPMAAKYASVSPYNYSFNDPVSLNDPSGADPYNHSPGTYFYGSYYTYDDYVPDRGGEYYNGMGWRRDGESWDLWGSASGYGSSMSGGLGAGWRPGQGGVADQIRGWNPNFSGPIRYADNSGNMRNAFASELDYANEKADRLGVASVGTIVWNPWAGEHVGDGKYRGGWVNSTAHLINKIMEKGYSLHVKKLLLSGQSRANGSCSFCGFADLLRNTPSFGFYQNPFHNAETVYVDHGWSFVGAEGDKGGFFILVGKDKGKFVPFKEVAGGGATDAGYGVELGRIDISGNPYDFNQSYLFGLRDKVWASGVAVGGAFAWSSFNGVDVYAYSIQIGFSLSPWLLSVGYNHGAIDPK